MLLSIMDAPEIKTGEPYPHKYLTQFQQLWNDPNIQTVVKYGRQLGLPDKWVGFRRYSIFSNLVRVQYSIVGLKAGMHALSDYAKLFK